MSRAVSVLLTLAVLAPIVYISVVLFTQGLPIVALVLDGVVLVFAAVFAYFSWRCPYCKRPFAGTLVGSQQSTTSDTATVRDTSGISHTVSTRRNRTVRTYRCRHCGATFYRG